MSVSYTRSDNNEKPVAIEIKLEKEKEMLRARQTTSQKKLHEYIDNMFEREQREKEKLQVYLQQKKLE
jgi:phosphoenolpyruvate synthase/pyruvate phosphate dikinase